MILFPTHIHLPLSCVLPHWRGNAVGRAERRVRPPLTRAPPRRGGHVVLDWRDVAVAAHVMHMHMVHMHMVVMVHCGVRWVPPRTTSINHNNFLRKIHYLMGWYQLASWVVALDVVGAVASSGRPAAGRAVGYYHPSACPW